MKLQGLVSACLLAAAVALPGAAIASNVEPGGFPPGLDGIPMDYGNFDLLHPNDWHNRDLQPGEYAFFGVHAGKGSGFFDDWRFTLDQDSHVAISLFDIEFSLPGLLGDEDHAGAHGASLFDNKYLVVSLFDAAGQLLGSTGENGILEAANLLAGEWYTLAVSGKVGGLFGSGYLGGMQVAEVPLGDGLPLFASALAVLAIRGRRRFNRQPAGA